MEPRDILTDSQPQSDARPGTPGVLRVNLFGGLDLTVDRRPYDHPYLHRRKVKTLLSLMVLTEGREVNTEYLQSIIWPNSAPIKNRNNFNNLWSLLRKALTPEGSEVCPYIQRHQGSCRLNRALVDSDLFELHDLCDRFQFDYIKPREALGLYHRLQAVWQGNLLPGQEDNAVIMRSRRVWRNRTVDALYMTALSLKQQGALDEAIWFAQAALGMDATREDVLRLEMRIHLDRGNPSRALSAYVQASRVLDEAYGIQPNAETVALAQEALGGAQLSHAMLIARIPVEPSGTTPAYSDRYHVTTVEEKDSDAPRGKRARSVAAGRFADGTLPKRTAR